MTPTRVPKEMAALRRRLHAHPSESGQATIEILMYSAIIVGVVLVVGAALQALGVDIIGKISSALGL